MSNARSDLFMTLGFFSRAVIVGSEVLALAVEQKADSATASSILEGTTYSSPSSCSIWALLEKKIAFASPGTLLYHDADLRNLVLVLGSAIQLYERKTEGSLTYTAVSRHKAGAFIPVRALLVEENGDKLLIYLGLSNQRTLTESASSLYVSKTDYKSPARLARMFYGCCVFNLTKNQLISERITPIKRKSPVLDLLYNAHSSTVVIKYLNHSAEPLMLTIDLNNSYTLVAQQGQNIEYTTFDGSPVFPTRCPQNSSDTVHASFIGPISKSEVNAVRLPLGDGIYLDLLTCNVTTETIYHVYTLGLSLSTTASIASDCSTALQETLKDTVGFLSPDNKVLFLHNRITRTLSYTTINELRNRVRMVLSAQAASLWSDEHRAYFEGFPIGQQDNAMEATSTMVTAKEYTQYRVHLMSLSHNNQGAHSMLSLTQESVLAHVEKSQAQDELIKAMSKRIEELEEKLDRSLRASGPMPTHLTEMLEQTQKRVDDLENMIVNIHEDGILAVPDAVENMSNKIAALEQREKDLKNMVTLNTSILQDKLSKVDSQIAILDQTVDEVRSLVPVFDDSFSDDDVASIQSPAEHNEDEETFTNKLEAEHLVLAFNDMEFERNSVALPFCTDSAGQVGADEPASLLTTADL
ncbi:hypothetical protein QR46_0848 [Giardia duodenalis assemblage B]|uniref:Uncharacterized protein n=1 Tax=Giardia duodenalis assemblage B TaxID=1394984 RepID=A0A132NYJ5_GIAIN|nr:hypothetical protein QR46_0848 [Giardia intestinalis assemblage B]